MKIVLLHPFDPWERRAGGLETYIRDFVGHAPADATVALIGEVADQSLDIGQPTSCTIGGREVPFLPVRRHDSSVRRGLLGSRTLRFAMAVIRHRSAVSQFIGSRQVSFDLRRIELAFAPIIFGKPFVQMLHGVGVPDTPSESRWHVLAPLHGILEWIAVRHSHRFFSVVNWKTDELRQRYPRYSQKFDTVYTWADPEVFRPTPLPPLDGGEVRVVYVGRLVEAKNPRLMFDAMRHIRRRGQNARLVCVSPDSPEHWCSGSIPEWVTWLGYLPSSGVAGAIASSHLGVLTSRFEGFPRAVLEFAASGRPVVSTPYRSAGELSAKLSRAFFVAEDHTPEAVATCLELVVNRLRRSEVNAADIYQDSAEFTPTQQLQSVFRAHREIGVVQNEN